MQNPHRSNHPHTDLTIRGTKIKLVRLSSRIPTTNYCYNLTKVGTGGSKQKCHRDSYEFNDVRANQQRTAYKLNVKNYTNQQAYGSTLKKIYEAIEYDDFKRFLKVFDYRQKVRPKKSASILNSAAIKDCYHDNFEVHYNVLKELVGQSGQCKDSV